MTKYLLIIVFLTGCSISKSGRKTPHEQYAAHISDAGLKETALGASWFTAAEKALLRPLTITLPYKETGYFEADKPDAAGYTFTAKQGEQLNIQVNIKPTGKLFIDLWQTTTLLTSADTITNSIKYEVERNGSFILRIQPELLYGVEYTINITTSPSLAFPVSGQTNSRIGSFWGDSRDRGARSHEGIDIFGKFRTPVVAAADGYVTRTGENNLGGKVVFMQPERKNYTLYYAHLDSQLVNIGQRVTVGDTLGLMGNTGNARNTPTHLHFGIYTAGGAIDPLPFIKSDKQEPQKITASLDLLSTNARNTNEKKLPPNQLMRIIAATGNKYKAILPDNQEVFIESRNISNKPYKSLTTREPTPLLDSPDSSAAIKRTIAKGENVSIIGIHKGYYFIEHSTSTGWMKETTL